MSTADALQAHDEFLRTFSTHLRAPAITAETDATFDVFDPATAKEIAKVADASPELSAQVMATAVLGFDEWRKQSDRSRSNVLLRAAELLLERRDVFAAMMTREMGKPFGEAQAEVNFSADYLRWYSEEAVRAYGGYRTAPAGGARLILSRAPVGPVLLITPWNFPLAMGARKAAAALAAGCSVILKPAELTPLTSLMFADLLYEAGVPETVFQVVTTSSSAAWSKALMADSRLKKVSFTGSTRVGSTLIQQSAQHVQKLSLELGGDAPFIVFDDADLDRAVSSAIVSKIRNGGQACVAANRFYVQSGIESEFVAELTRRMDALKVGSGFEQGVDMGPLISEQALDKVSSLVSEAIELGAERHTAAPSNRERGYFLDPVLLTGVSTEASIAEAEIFAPVATVNVFDSAEEVVHRANQSPFGLAGYVFSQDIDQAFGVAHALEVGVLGINKGLVADASSPFGGIGYSGYGREGGSEGMQDFQVLKQLNLDLPAAAQF